MKKLFIYAVLSAILSIVNYYTNFGFFVSKEILYIVSPVETSGFYVLNSVSNVVKHYIALQNAQVENANLKSKINKLTLENGILKAKLYNNDVKSTPNMIKCPFIFKDFSNINYIYIKCNAPEKNILHKTVVSEKLNLVGTVVSKIGDLYAVKTVFNSNFVADCFIINNGKFYRGIFKGSLYQPKVEFLNTQSSIQKNDLVVTSGLIGNLPPNIDIGTIEAISEVRGFYKIALVRLDKTFLNNNFVFVVN